MIKVYVVSDAPGFGPESCVKQAKTVEADIDKSDLVDFLSEVMPDIFGCSEAAAGVEEQRPSPAAKISELVQDVENLRSQYLKEIAEVRDHYEVLIIKKLEAIREAAAK